MCDSAYTPNDEEASPDNKISLFDPDRGRTTLPFSTKMYMTSTLDGIFFPQKVLERAKRELMLLSSCRQGW